MSGLATETIQAPPDMQVYIVGVRLLPRLASKSSSYRVDGKWLRFGDACVVEHGEDFAIGKVWLPPRLPAIEGRIPSQRVVRIASPEDLDRERQREELERTAYTYALETIRTRDLPMKLSKVEYAFDGRKAVFFFTAEGRVDFRGLVKDLAQRVRIRVEMRQIGVRDEAGLLGGIGICGRELCCTTWLKDFAPVSIKAAKQQGLTLNPSKLSGLCGRLRCCLNYELPGYGNGGLCGGGNCRKQDSAR